MSDFSGRRAVVAGGGRGVGLACARLIARRGGLATLVGHDAELLHRAEETLRAERVGAAARVADLGIEAEVAGAVKGSMKVLGPIDILINHPAI